MFARRHGRFASERRDASAKPKPASPGKIDMKHIGKYVLSGIVTIIPLWVTWLVVAFVFRQLLSIGVPILAALRQWLVGIYPQLSDRFSWALVENTSAVILTVLLFYLIGWSVSQIFGRRLLGVVEAVLDRVPIVKSVYGGVRKLISALQTTPEGGQEGQRVVLINFPSEEMKTIGLVTRTMTEETTGRKLAIVYVPTTPNPTSGYLEIVPIERVVATDWTLDEAMNFIITAGAVAPSRPVAYANGPHHPLPEKAITTMDDATFRESA
jgi:uncharacterized membrane protein